MENKMIKPSIKDMLSGKESKYALVIGVAKRAREIADELALSNPSETRKPVNLAIEDFKEGKYAILEPEINSWTLS